MANGFTKMGFYLPLGTDRPHGELGDLVIKVNEAFHNHPPGTHAATGHGEVPGFLQIRRAIELALAFAG